MLPLDGKQREEHLRHRLVEAHVSPVQRGAEKRTCQRDGAGSDLGSRPPRIGGHLGDHFGGCFGCLYRAQARHQECQLFVVLLDRRAIGEDLDAGGAKQRVLRRPPWALPISAIDLSISPVVIGSSTSNPGKPPAPPAMPEAITVAG